MAHGPHYIAFGAVAVVAPLQSLSSKIALMNRDRKGAATNADHRRVMMSRATRFALAVVIFGAAAHAQQSPYPKPTELPNPYHLVAGWPTLPTTMNGGRWGEVIRVHVA